MKTKGLIIIVLFALVRTAAADTTWGLGVGPLYSGIGINLGRTTSTTLTYGAVGCLGVSITRSSNSEEDMTESNCGVGLGYIDTSWFGSNRHGLGLSVNLSDNTRLSQTEVRIRPGYYYFFNGINQRGVNLGLGTTVYYDTEESNDGPRDAVVGFLNIGYQF